MRPRNVILATFFKKLKRLTPYSVKSAGLYVSHKFRGYLDWKKKASYIRVRPKWNYWIVRDVNTNFELAVPSFTRWSRYRGGIQRQLENLADCYGYGRNYELGPGDVVLDVGANVGEFAIFAAGRGATVLAFEADPLAYKLLARNVATLNNVWTYNYVLWNKCADISFYSSPKEADSSVIRPAEYYRVRSRRAVTVDWWWEAVGRPQLHLLKCDVEGAEPELLEGAWYTLRNTRWVAIDCGYERHGLSTLHQCTELLRAAGFNAVEIRRGSRPIVVAVNEA